MKIGSDDPLHFSEGSENNGTLSFARVIGSINSTLETIIIPDEVLADDADR